ncbi:MAG: FecR family protein, partial [Rhabdochlamydiaceae bacterium]
MNKKQFIRILHKYEKGKSTEEENQLIETYYDLLLAKLKLESDRIDAESGGLKEELLSKVWAGIRKEEQGKGRIISRLPLVMEAAAVFIILLGIGGFFLTVKRRQVHAKVELQDNAANLTPGGNKAVLTLANGKKIILDSISNGSLARQGNVNIIKLKSGQLAYKGALSGGGREHQLVYNTLSTPRGGQYEVILPDGSKVWLNAESSLHYPVTFTKKTRTVEVMGEAYFEIAPNALKPFIVKVSDEKIEVLGT